MEPRKAFDNSMRGVLFARDKGGNDKRPDYKGTAEVAGIEYILSAWIETAKDMTKYIQLRFEPKRAANPVPPSAAPSDAAPFNDEIPF